MLVDAAGQRPLEVYACCEHAAAFTLTQREADLIALAHPGVRPPQALEKLHPWLPAQKYLGDAGRGYRQLLAITRRYGRHFFSASSYCDESWTKICNALRMANPQDSRFYAAWHLPLQEAFVLAEERPDRRVLAIDFNSLYPACMQQDFPEPRRLRQIELQREFVPGEPLPVGLYRCRLSGEVSTFIRRYNPFRGFFSGRYLGVSLADGISIDLNEFEIAFYQRHFRHVYLVDAVVSDRVVAHPLAMEARRAFARRQSYKAQINKPLADREKFRMTLLASCAGRPLRETPMFPSYAEAMEHLKCRYGIVRHTGEPAIALTTWLGGGRKVSLIQRSDVVAVTGPALEDGSACHSLSQRIVARARTRVLEEMEHIASLSPGIEICYCNIDSIHFSVPQTSFDSLLERVRARSSNEMGGYKIEAIVRHGLWLEPGRYWLYGDAVEKFSNSGVGDGVAPFNERKVYVASRLIDGLHVPVKATLDLAGSMSDARGAEHDAASGIVRQPSVEMTEEMDYAAILARLSEHRDHAVPRKLAAFQALRDRLKNERKEFLATLPRCEEFEP